MPTKSVHLNSEDLPLSRSVQRQRLLADVAQLFLANRAFSEQINQALLWIGNDAGVSRIYIFEDSPDGSTTSNTYEWCNAEIEPQIDELQEVPYEIIPNWNAILDRDGRIFSTDIHRELPEDLLAVLGPQGIKSILIIPLQKFERRFGFIGFDECTQNRAWALEDLELLRSLSGIISAAYEREQIRSELKLGEIRLTMALENAGTGLWDWNMENNRVEFNKEGCSMLGLDNTKNPLTLEDWENQIHPSDQNSFRQELNALCAAKSSSIENVHRVKSTENQWKWVRIQGKAVEWNTDGTPLRTVGTQIDIDTQKKIEEELRHLNTSKDLFFTVLAHDLKAPLLSIMQMSASTKNNRFLARKDWQALLSAQEIMAKNSLNLLENLFHWAGFQKGALAFFPEQIDAFLIAKNEIDSLQQAIDFKSLHVNLTELKARFVYADKVLLGIVFRNLLHNAIKFSHKNERILIRSIPGDGLVFFEIQDFGLGIPEEFSGTLLNDNSFNSSFGTNNEHGSGIGLKIAKKFIQQQGGSLEFHSFPGKGCTFRFSLPLAPTP